jgi:hypothetical protein
VCMYRFSQGVLHPTNRKRRYTFSTMANLHLVNTGSSIAPKHHRSSLLLSPSFLRFNVPSSSSAIFLGLRLWLYIKNWKYVSIKCHSSNSLL